MMDLHTAREYLPPFLGRLDQLVDERLKRDEKALVIRWEGQGVSAGQLLRNSENLTARLRSLGAGRDARIGLSVEHSPALVAAILGILRSGSAFVPLEPGQPEERLHALAVDAGVRAIVASPAEAARMASWKIPLVTLDAPGALLLPEGSPSGGSMATAGEIDDPMVVVYTSGSTGRPKGVLKTHHQACAGQLGLMTVLGVGPEDRILLRGPISNSALTCEVMWALLAGGRLVIARHDRKADTRYLVELVRNEGVTIVMLVPSLLRALLDEPGLAGCTRLRHVAAAGEALAGDLAARCEAVLPGRLWAVYGATEAPAATARRIGSPETPPRSVGSPEPGAPMNVGRPVGGTRVYVLDPERRPTPAGEVGEIYLGGGGVAQGYLGDPDLTAQRFIPDPLSPGGRLYRTGDLGRLCEDGSLELHGRADEQIKIRGHRVEPAEIEATLRAHDDVRDAVVRARCGPDGESRLVAWVVPAHEPPSSEALRLFAASRLPAYMVPSVFLTLAQLPRTTAGKIDRNALPEPPRAEGRATGSGEESPSGTRETASPPSLEEWLVRTWRALLARDDVGLHDDFLALGGHSLLAGRLVTRIEATWGVRLPMSTVFLHPTIDELARTIRARQGDASGSPS